MKKEWDIDELKKSIKNEKGSVQYLENAIDKMRKKLPEIAVVNIYSDLRRARRQLKEEKELLETHEQELNKIGGKEEL